MIENLSKQTKRQARTTTPASIAEINDRLMAQRISAREATGLLRAEYPVWGAMRGQFKGRKVFVGLEFVVKCNLDDRGPVVGFLGLLSVEPIDFAKHVDGRENGIRFIGNAVVAHLFEDIARSEEVAKVFVSIPAELSYEAVAQRAIYAETLAGLTREVAL